jgi:hypothetical protein
VMVMVSLNLADIMTATRPRPSQPLREESDKEADPTSLGRLESQLLTKLDESEHKTTSTDTRKISVKSTPQNGSAPQSVGRR